MTGSDQAGAGGARVAGSGAATAAAGGTGATMARRSKPQPAQNLCSAAIRGVPHLGQGPNPVAMSSLPFATRCSELAQVGWGSGGSAPPLAEHDPP